jgi:cytochrome c oxidase assembly protein subunit 15
MAMHEGNGRVSKALRIWAWVVAGLTLVVNQVGFLDTVTGSALGCGQDWPLCNGRILPALSNVHVIIEFTHRAIVGGFAVITVALAVWAWMRYRRSAGVRAFAAMAVGFIVIQSLLGAAAVLWVNPPVVLALHLGFGLLGLVGTLLLAVMIFRLEAPDPDAAGAPFPSNLRRLVLVVWVYTFVAIYWGSYVAFRGAGPACRGWPLCNGRWIPTSGLVWLDVIHRLAAVGLAVWVAVLLVGLFRWRETAPDLRWTTILLAVLTGTQIASGAYLVLRHWTVGPYLLHVGNLTVLFSLLSYLAFRSLERLPMGGASGERSASENGGDAAPGMGVKPATPRG